MSITRGMEMHFFCETGETVRSNDGMIRREIRHYNRR